MYPPVATCHETCAELSRRRHVPPKRTPIAKHSSGMEGCSRHSRTSARTEDDTDTCTGPVQPSRLPLAATRFSDPGESSAAAAAASLLCRLSRNSLSSAAEISLKPFNSDSLSDSAEPERRPALPGVTMHGTAMPTRHPMAPKSRYPARHPSSSYMYVPNDSAAAKDAYTDRLKTPNTAPRLSEGNSPLRMLVPHGNTTA